MMLSAKLVAHVCGDGVLNDRKNYSDLRPSLWNIFIFSLRIRFKAILYIERLNQSSF